MTSLPTSVLLDKSVLREALRAVARLLQQEMPQQEMPQPQTQQPPSAPPLPASPLASTPTPLPERQFLALAALVALMEQGVTLTITEPLHHILLQPHAFPVAQLLLPRLHVLRQGRYLRRWARRLQEEGFTREDAVLVSHGSFGLDFEAATFGAASILTTDYALKAHYERHFTRLSRRFDSMTHQLAVPYREAALPSIHTPAEMLEILFDE